ncbi:hypothetical protein, partial [Aeromonas veronii]
MKWHNIQRIDQPRIHVGWDLQGVVSQISQQVMTSPVLSDHYTRGFLT